MSAIHLWKVVADKTTRFNGVNLSSVLDLLLLFIQLRASAFKNAYLTQEVNLGLVSAACRSGSRILALVSGVLQGQTHYRKYPDV